MYLQFFAKTFFRFGYNLLGTTSAAAIVIVVSCAFCVLPLLNSKNVFIITHINKICFYNYDYCMKPMLLVQKQLNLPLK